MSRDSLRTTLLLATLFLAPFVATVPVQADTITSTGFTFSSGPVSGEATARHGDWIYLLGGVSASGQVLDTIWRVNVVSGANELMTTRLPFAVKNAAAGPDFMPNDPACPYWGPCILIAGGTKADGSLSNKVWAFHQAESWAFEQITEIMTLPQARTEMGYSFGYIWGISDQVLILAGGRTSTGLSRDVLFLDSDERRIAYTQQLPSARRFSTVHHFSNHFLIMGGQTSTGLTSEVRWYDGVDFGVETSMPTATAGAVSLEGIEPDYLKPCSGGCPWFIIVIGGEGQSNSQAGVPNSKWVRAYDHFDNEWFELGRPNVDAEFQGRTALRSDGDSGFLVGAKNPGSGTAHNVIYKFQSDTAGSPSPPLNLVATADGVGRITLTWERPIYHQNPTSYRIYRDAESQRHSLGATPYATAGGSSLTWSDTGLGAGETHTYSVTAATGSGESFWSRTASAQTWRLPSEPQNVVVQAGPGNGQITTTWSVPLTNGGSAVTGYRLYRGDVQGVYQDLPASPRSFTDSGLGDGVTKTYTVAAVTAVGEGPGVTGSATTFKAPGQPQNLVAEPGTLAGEIVLEWEAPDDGGRPITGYNIYRSIESGQEQFLLNTGSGATTYTDRPTTEEGAPDELHPYHYRVQAVTAFGTGPLSWEACSWPGPALPVSRSCDPLPV